MSVGKCYDSFTPFPPLPLLPKFFKKGIFKILLAWRNKIIVTILFILLILKKRA